MAAAIPLAIVAATAVTAYSAYEQGRRQKSIAEDNQRIANENAAAILEAGKKGSEAKIKEGKRFLSAQYALDLGKSGFTSEGTPTWLADYTAAQFDEDAATIYENAVKDSRLVRQKGQIEAMQGQYAYEGGLLTAVGTGLKGASEGYLGYKYGPSVYGPRLRT